MNFKFLDKDSHENKQTIVMIGWIKYNLCNLENAKSLFTNSNNFSDTLFNFMNKKSNINDYLISQRNIRSELINDVINERNYLKRLIDSIIYYITGHYIFLSESKLKLIKSHQNDNSNIDKILENYKLAPTGENLKDEIKGINTYKELLEKVQKIYAFTSKFITYMSRKNPNAIVSYDGLCNCNSILKHTIDIFEKMVG